jgi:hypothetical protein
LLEEFKFTPSIKAQIFQCTKSVLLQILHLWCYSCGLAIALLPLIPNLMFALRGASSVVILVAFAPVLWHLIQFWKAREHPTQQDAEAHMRFFWDGLPVVIFIILCKFLFG